MKYGGKPEKHGIDGILHPVGSIYTFRFRHMDDRLKIYPEQEEGSTRMKEFSMDWKVRKKCFVKSLKRNYQLLILLALPLAWLLLFKYGPMYGLMMAFKDFDVQKGMWGSEWVGLRNFEKFFNHYQFKKVVMNTLSLSFYYLLASFPFPIILALALNCTKHKKYAKAVQTITYMPYFISTVVLVGIILQLLNTKVGLVPNLTAALGAAPKDLLADPKWFKHIYVWSGVWQNCGWGTIVYLAALAGVDNDLHEAAMIDGASRFKRMIHIDVPCIMPTASIMLILNAGNIMNVGFEKVFLLQNNLNKDASEIIATFTYTIGLSSAVPDIPMATAIGMFNSVINLVLVVIVNSITRKISNTSLF